MNKTFLLLFFIWFTVAVNQQAPAQIAGSTNRFIDLSLGAGNSEGSIVAAFNYDKGLGKKGKIIIGFGGRLTSYLGKNQYYITAPAQLTSGGTGPGVLFKDNIDNNIDTLLIKTSWVTSINLFVTLGYTFSEKVLARFNIDAIGFSVGKNIEGNYINGPHESIESAKPTPFNALLISDNDRGSLNSELFVRYLIHNKWGIKAGIQFHFTEYTTDSYVQQVPEPNDRFRNKSLMLSAGVSYRL
jgi:hypothetical protein